MSLTVEEGRVLTRFARRHQRVVQIGTQQRSMPINIYASKLVSSGKIGKIKEVIACNFISPEGWTPHMAYPAPAGLDWDQWCNQTELRPYHPQLHRRWGQWWAYDGGGLSWGVTGWGAHALDQVQAALGTDHTGPVEIWLGKSEAPGLRRTVTARYASGTLLKLEQEDPAGRFHRRPAGAEERRTSHDKGRSRGNAVPPAEFLRLHPVEEAAERGCGDRSPLLNSLPPGEHLPHGGPETEVGPTGGKVPRRRGSQLDAFAGAPEGLRTAASDLSGRRGMILRKGRNTI